MFIATETTVSFKLPEEGELAKKFSDDNPDILMNVVVDTNYIHYKFGGMYSVDGLKLISQ